MKKTTIYAEKAPSAIGPYGHANTAGDFVFVSGQLGIDPATEELLEGVENQARQAFENLKVVLEEAGTSLDSVVKTTVFLSDMADFPAINEIYGRYFTANYPARSCVAVSTLPKNAEFEIEAIAVK